MNRIEYASPEVVHYGIAIPFTAGGDVLEDTLALVRGFGLTAIERTAVGVYTLTFDRHFNAFLAIALLELEATATLGSWKVTAKSNGGAAGPATIELTHLNAAGSEANPVSGDEIYLTVDATQSPLASSTRCVYTDSV